MNAKIIPILPTLVLCTLLHYSCDDATYREYKGNEPVYLPYEDLRTGVATEQNQELKNPGKIYFKDNYIFIVEEQKGIHIFDNTDPSSPVNKVFIKLPGIVDISISGYIMYADSYVDMVVLDIQNIDDIHEVGRLKDIFPYMVPSTGNDYPMTNVDQTKGVVIGWNLKIIREKVNFNPTPYPIFWERGAYFLDKVNAAGASSGVSGSGVGIGGSMARFGIKDNVLYVLKQNSLKIFDITNKTSPSKCGDIYSGWNIETLFLTEKNMFLGTATGMAVYDISVPLSPSWITFFNHARSCDPVVVDDTLAYITLRTGSNCGGSLNVLDVVSIKNLSAPSLIMSYPMTNPHGLAKSGDLLFICDADAGLKVYDASNPRLISMHLVYTYPNINAYDVIPVGNVLVLTGDDGLYQYNFSNVQNITLLSKIAVVKN
jgi:hypothetical protein